MNNQLQNINLSISGKLVLLFSIVLIAFSVEAKTIPEIRSINTDVYARFLNFTPYLGNTSFTIVDIHQDRYGYIWLAGPDGLFRFDGNKVRHYVNDWTPNALPSTEVYSITTDTLDRLWIGTKAGICYYDYKNDEFIKLFVAGPQPQNPDSLFVRKIMAEGDSLLWMDTHQGYLWKIDLKTLKLIDQYKHVHGYQPYYYYHAVFRDNQNMIWLGGRGKGPYSLNEKSRRITGALYSNYKYIPGKKLGTDVAYFHIDRQGNFWVGSTDGIYLFNKEKNYYHLFYRSSSWAMLEDHSGMLWFGVAGGLARYDPITQVMTMFLPNEEDNRSLSGSYIYDIFEDSYHQIWIASGNGISVFKPKPKGINYLFHIPGEDGTLISSSVSSMAKDHKGMIWIGTTAHGVERYDPSKNSFSHFNKTNTRGLISDKVRNVHISPSGAVYLSLWSGVGFGKLNASKKFFKLYSYDNKSTLYDWYNDMEFTKSGNIYLGFWGAHGLTYFDAHKETFGRNFQNKFFNSYESRLITTLARDKYNRIWMGTTTAGLHLYIPEKDTSICFHTDINPEKGINENKIYDIEPDPSGNVWIAAKGLYYGNADSLTVHRVELGDQYQNLNIYGVIPENPFTVWLMTDVGLVKYHRKEQSMINYAHTVHLIFGENNAAAVKLNDGRLMFGGKNGLAVVDPAQIKLGYQTPHVFLSSLFVFDKLKIANLSDLKKVELSHSENFFRIQIGSDVWGENVPFKFFYKLEGFNNDWVEVSPVEMEARFTNVPPGKYLFHVKAEDAQGNKYTNIAECSVSVLPPFWMKSWFVVLIVLLVASISYFIWLNRIRNMRLSLFNMELNQKLLRSQMNPHFMFNALSAIQSYIYSSQPHIAGEYLSDFAHLFRRILKNSNKELIPFSEEMETVELYLKLQQLRFNNSFDFEVSADSELKESDYEIPPMLAQPFLENAVEHGVKNLEIKGIISIDYRLVDDVINCKIRDNGIGLTASKEINKKTGHESMALSIVNKRLAILSKKKGLNLKFAINEMRDEKGRITGTKVTFDIPIT